MGNQYSNDGDQCLFLPSQFVKPVYLTKKKKSDRVNEQLIIELHRKQIRDGMTSTHLTNEWMTSDQRRLVFVSCLGLYQTWTLCPAAILYSAIFVLPLQRQWIYHPLRYKQEIQESILGQLRFQDDEVAFAQFMDLLRWKDGQNLAFWMLDEMHPVTKSENTPSDATDIRVGNELVDPFWIRLSDALSNVYDPITRTNYKPLKFNAKWWQFTYDALAPSQYNTPRYKILSELYFVGGKFKAIQEILYQSNPSLNPITAYNPFHPAPSQPAMNGFVNVKKKDVDHYGFVAFHGGCCPDIKDDDDGNIEDKDDGVWMISTEYDENDLSDCHISV